MTVFKALGLIGLLGVAGTSTLPAIAGPPFRTDDPEPVERGHLELYVFGAGQWRGGDRAGVGPALEFNYGILPDTQFHVVLPAAYDHPEGMPGRAGLGDTEIGVKFRFLHETDVLPQIGVFPMVEVPTGRAESGLGAGHTQVYLPVWVQKSWGPWTTYGGYGWWRNPGAGQRNWSYAGWLLQREVSGSLTLGAEVFRNTAPGDLDPASSGFNAGGIVNLSDKHHLLFSVGRTVSGVHQTQAYLGYQLTMEAPTALSKRLHPNG
ncbi:hypothetical protein [Mesoterricola silvestris]|uniref:Transporter n=1 Tax=Mesoterricola silvestris TaxID=2927979 RepID=A0AA48KA37_9BACT|nr:hypothetical protein [Mesoterricola silvestris]BDU73715.1 hypothetical protein METEAL_28890 [Mesoterricola silvestris]